jgi:hypothetical protein
MGSSDPVLKAAMVAVTGAAFAIDSFSGSVKDAIGEPPALRQRTNQRERVRALLMRAGYFKNGKTLAEDLKWIFMGRRILVHHREGPHLPPYFAVQEQFFKADAAKRAVEIMFTVLATCIREPKPEFEPWVSHGRESLLRALEKELGSA